MGVEPGKVEVSGRAAGGLLFRLCGCMASGPGLAKGGWLDLGLRKEDGMGIGWGGRDRSTSRPRQHIGTSMFQGMLVVSLGC
jgi:hypothetical protein